MEENWENSDPIRSSYFISGETLNKTKNVWEIPSSSKALYGSNDVSLFSSSLPVIRHDKLNFVDAFSDDQLTGDASYKLKNPIKDVEGKISADDLDVQGSGVLLPDDEEALLSGLMDDLNLSGLPNQIDELEDYDLFGNLGGLELDSDPLENTKVGATMASISDGFLGNGINQYTISNGVGTISGEHPYGEHPSRTLFVRNINSNVEDSELRSLFEQYGDIRNLYTACKHRGFVMISYYDIRAARTAMHALQNKPLRRRKLDIHFSIPKDNPSDKDMNQGTLVIFNLDSSVSNDELRQIFGAYGEVKEIRETPHKKHHKFIEFYDVRAAENALRSLNKCDIAGKRIKLEPSRPGGARRNMIQQLTNDFEQDESRAFWHHGGSPIGNSPPGLWTQFDSPNDKNSLQFLSRSPNGGPISPIGSNHLPGLSSAFPPIVSNSVKIAPIGKDQNRSSHADQVISNSSPLHGGVYQLSHSFPDHSQGVVAPSSGNSASFGPSTPNASDVGTLTGSQFLWGNSITYTENKQPSRQPHGTGGSMISNGQGQGQSFLYSSSHGSFLGSSLSQHAHRVGSAPSVAPFERQYGYFSESPETSFIGQFGFRKNLIKRNGGTSLMSMNPQATMNQGIISGSIPDPNVRMMPAQRFGPVVFGNAPFSGLNSIGIDGLVDRNRSRRADNQGSQADNKKLYQLDLEKIIKGEDTRTTIMIKNIPNKYTSKMLLAAIDETHRGTYDFLYLPIDFKNKCNVGYAFINMASPSHIVSFYEAFNGKRWEKFNSEKVASLAYARIQGRPALVAHFQNSSLMNEDKRCRPILFYSEGAAEAGDQELFSIHSMHIQDGSIPMRDSESSPDSSSSKRSELSTLPISITSSESYCSSPQPHIYQY
ncbi:protein MEI2-like 2 isoform X2 [Curcuma longa]